jgi:hypothetical protein
LAGGCKKAKPLREREQNQKNTSWQGLCMTTTKAPKLGNDNRVKRHELMQINHPGEMSHLELQANEEERE